MFHSIRSKARRNRDEKCFGLTYILLLITALFLPNLHWLRCNLYFISCCEPCSAQSNTPSTGEPVFCIVLWTSLSAIKYSIYRGTCILYRAVNLAQRNQILHLQGNLCFISCCEPRSVQSDTPYGVPPRLRNFSSFVMQLDFKFMCKYTGIHSGFASQLSDVNSVYTLVSVYL
jgi:hypothetical protein